MRLTNTIVFAVLTVMTIIMTPSSHAKPFNANNEASSHLFPLYIPNIEQIITSATFARDHGFVYRTQDGSLHTIPFLNTDTSTKKIATGYNTHRTTSFVYNPQTQKLYGIVPRRILKDIPSFKYKDAVATVDFMEQSIKLTPIVNDGFGKIIAPYGLILNKESTKLTYISHTHTTLTIYQTDIKTGQTQTTNAEGLNTIFSFKPFQPHLHVQSYLQAVCQGKVYFQIYQYFEQVGLKTTDRKGQRPFSLVYNLNTDSFSWQSQLPKKQQLDKDSCPQTSVSPTHTHVVLAQASTKTMGIEHEPRVDILNTVDNDKFNLLIYAPNTSTITITATSQTAQLHTVTFITANRQPPEIYFNGRTFGGPIYHHRFHSREEAILIDNLSRADMESETTKTYMLEKGFQFPDEFIHHLEKTIGTPKIKGFSKKNPNDGRFDEVYTEVIYP